MTKQDIIRSLKKDLQDLKQFALVVVLLVTFFGAIIGTYKGYMFISDTVEKAFEPTVEEVKAQKAKAEEQKLFNDLMTDCESRTPVGWEKYNQYAFCYKQSLTKAKELLKKQKKKKK